MYSCKISNKSFQLYGCFSLLVFCKYTNTVKNIRSLILFTQHMYILLGMKGLRREMIFHCLPREEIRREKKRKRRQPKKGTNMRCIHFDLKRGKQTRKKLISHLIHGGWYPEKCISGLLAKMGKRPRCVRESRDSPLPRLLVSLHRGIKFWAGARCTHLQRNAVTLGGSFRLDINFAR